jgi:hypothetical protein
MSHRLNRRNAQADAAGKTKSGATLSGRAALIAALINNLPVVSAFSAYAALLANAGRAKFKACRRRAGLLESRHNSAKIDEALRCHD